MPAIDLRLLAAAILVALALASCAKPHPRPAPSFVLGAFDGVLPCADCGGLDTRLTLVEDRPGAPGGTYFLSEDYIGKSPKPFESSGHWTTLKGNAKNPDAVIYVLDPDKPERVRYFLRRDDGSLLMLDRERNEIDAPFDLSLKPRESTKSAAVLANPAAVNCARQGGRSEIRTDTAGGQYGVCVFSDGRACEEWALFRDGTCVKAKGEGGMTGREAADEAASGRVLGNASDIYDIYMYARGGDISALDRIPARFWAPIRIVGTYREPQPPS